MRKHLFVTLLLACGMTHTGSFAVYAAPLPQQQSQPVVTVNGTVLDENNEPVIGASVYEKDNKTNAAATDFDGNFALNLAPGTMLRISYVGYKTLEVAASQGMQVYLEPTTEQLNELVAIGYGTQKRANLTGAVATVDVARVMDSRPVSDATKALQGAIPGLTITSGSGSLNEDATIRVRGTGTLTNGQNSAPLIVVDGVPVDDLNFVNPDDIEAISVLKDASSSAIYGSRASFGVILITTKNPSKEDRVSVSYSANFGWSGATVLPQFANTVDQIKTSLQGYYRNPTPGNAATEVGGMNYTQLLPFAEAWQQLHGGKPYKEYCELHPYVDENNVGDFYVYKDNQGNDQWLRYADWDLASTLFSNHAPSQKHNVTLEGTSGKTQYRLSFGYDSRQGTMKINPDKLNRYTANANVSTEITSWLKAGTRISYTQREFMEPNTGRNSYQYLWRWAPYMETYGWITNPADDKPLTFRNEIMNRGQAYTEKTVSRSTRLQAWINAEIIKGLNLQADFTYDVRTVNNHSAWALVKGWNGWGSAYSIYQWPTAGQPSTRARKWSRTSDRWTMNVFATYARTFANAHNLKVMLGASAEQYRRDGIDGYRYGLVDYSLPHIALTDGGIGGTNMYVTGDDDHRATAGFFGRVNYDYNGIYLFEFNLRRDGSTSFPANDQWAWFPSVSAGYRFSEENYFAPLKKIISNGKIRASYGHIGNEGVPEFTFLPTIDLGNQNVNWITSQGILASSASVPKLVSKSLTWERIETADIGLDLGLFNNQLTLGFDWYQRLTNDMLAPGMPAPSTLGISVPLRNAGSLRTRGWELSVGWNRSFGDAMVYAQFNLSDAQSKVTRWDSNDNNTLYSYTAGKSGYLFFEGQNFGDVYGFEVDRYFEESDFTGKNENGVWQYAPGVANQDYLAYNPFTFGPGDVKFVDQNGDGVINNGNDKMIRLDGKTYVPGQEGYEAALANPNHRAVPVGTVDNCGDLKVVGNALPRYEYSFRIGGAWKGFDLDLYFQGVGKRKMWQLSSFNIPFAAKNDGIFQHQLDGGFNKYIVNDADQIIGYEIDQNNLYPALYGGVFGYNSRMRATCDQGLNNFTCSDRYMVNMAYLRMKNITVGYTIPVDLTKKAYIQRARVYFSCENPFFIYNGAGKYSIDPELTRGEAASAYSANGNAAMYRVAPILRTYSFGLQVTF